MKNFVFALAAISFTVIFCTVPVSADLYEQWHDNEKEVFGLVNLQRNHIGLSDLIPDSRLHVAADLHSRDMAKNDYFNHDSQDGTEFWERVQAQNYDFDYTGENIAVGYHNAYNVMYGTDDLSSLNDFDIRLGNNGVSSWNEVGQGWSDDDWYAWDTRDQEHLKEEEKGGLGGWMGSSGHRGNILSVNYTDIGVGYYYMYPDPGNIDDHHYWTQDFASGDTAAVPLPPAILMFGSGLIGMVGFRRHKK